MKPLGRTVSRLLSEYFPRVIDVDFTAKLEDGLDLIEEDEKNWVASLSEFYATLQEEMGFRKKDDEEPEAGGEGNLYKVRQVRQEHDTALGQERGVPCMQRQACLQE